MTHGVGNGRVQIFCEISCERKTSSKRPPQYLLEERNDEKNSRSRGHLTTSSGSRRSLLSKGEILEVYEGTREGSSYLKEERKEGRERSKKSE